MINFTVSGSSSRTSKFLQKMQTPGQLYSGLESLAQRGVTALQSATPKDSGLTAASWSYEIEIKNESASITWNNTNVQSGANVAILIQYGHGTGTGGYVSGQDFINPAIKPIFDEIANDIWKKVTSA